MAFGKSYRKSASLRNEYGLDEKDAGNIIVIGIIGMIMLLPMPIVITYLRSKIVIDKKEDSLP